MSGPDRYNDSAANYDLAHHSDTPIPHARIEIEIIGRLLGSCLNLRILDIAGGSGGYARRAISAGAAHVDVVDLSADMLAEGKKIEVAAGRGDSSKIGWHQANAYKPIRDQVPELPVGAYDVALSIWATDDAEKPEDIENLWKNAATYLKAGGKLIALRVQKLPVDGSRFAKYGNTWQDIEPIPGGMRYTYSMLTNPPCTIQASTMEVSYNGSTELLEKAGFEDIQPYDLRQTDLYKSDPSFWKLMVEEPYFVVFSAIKG